MRVAAALVLVLTAGCAHEGGARDPTVSARAWLAALDHDDAHAAYALLAPSLRAHRPEAEFVAAWQQSARERQDQAAALRQALAAPALERRAEVRLADGRVAALVREPADWRVAAVRPLAEPAATPEEALHRFVAALDERNVDAVLALLAEPLRSTVEQALTSRLEKLRAAVGKGEVEVNADRARLRYDARFHVDLVRENGNWRVADFN